MSGEFKRVQEAGPALLLLMSYCIEQPWWCPTKTRRTSGVNYGVNWLKWDPHIFPTSNQLAIISVMLSEESAQPTSNVDLKANLKWFKGQLLFQVLFSYKGGLLVNEKILPFFSFLVSFFSSMFSSWWRRLDQTGSIRHWRVVWGASRRGGGRR